MTPSVQALLTKLRDEGPQPRRRYGSQTSFRAFQLGWVEWADDTFFGEKITADGIAALEKVEKEQEANRAAQIEVSE